MTKPEPPRETYICAKCGLQHDAPAPTPEPRPLSISDCTERDYAINGRTMYSIKPEAGTPEPPRLPVKNRNIPGGKEFWNHVEDVAKNLQPPLWGSPRCPKCGSDDRTIHKRLRIEPMSEFDPPDDCECFDPWHKGETPSALSAALVKLNNYLLAHQKGIDMRWVGHVLEEATQEAADLRSKLSESEKWRLIGIAQMKEWEEQLSTAERERELSDEINRSHSALIGKIQATIDKAYPNSREGEYDTLDGSVFRLMKRAEDAEAELARYKEALKAITHYQVHSSYDSGKVIDAQAKQIAEAALRTGGEPITNKGGTKSA